jgi:hypothetical protein
VNAVVVAWALGIVGVTAAGWLAALVWRASERADRARRLRQLGELAVGSAVLGTAGSLLIVITMLGSIGGVSSDPSQRAVIYAGASASDYLAALPPLLLLAVLPYLIGLWSRGSRNQK